MFRKLSNFKKKYAANNRFHSRTRLVQWGFLLASLVLLLRSFYLQVVWDNFLLRKGDKISSHVVEIPASRGRILDRSGVVLAMSTPVRSVLLCVSDFFSSHFKGEETNDFHVRLTAFENLLGISDSFFHEKLHSNTDWVFVKKNVPPSIARQVADLDIPGVYLQRAYKRYYPARESAAQLVGIIDVSDHGQAGVERLFDHYVEGIAGSRRVLRDRKGRAVDDVAAIRVPVQGKDLVLSIDHVLQEEAYSALLKKVKETHAIAGSAVVVDAQTGEILALANVPSLNPNNRTHVFWPALRNRALTDMFEPGSTMKPFTVALALEKHKVTPSSLINTENGRFKVESSWISDMHPERALTVTQVIQKSSNIGIAKLALMFHPDEMAQMLSSLGFGESTQLGLSGEASGLLRSSQHWKKIEQATIAYGQGIAVTLVQLVRAYTVFAHHGQIIPLTLLKREEGLVVGKTVFSPETIKKMTNMLARVVETGGTAGQAKINGYRVGGKTGTAYKVHDGKYVHRYIASFVGLAPLSYPRFVVGVMIDDPKGANHYGGGVAAPVFHTIMLSALRRFIVSPDQPEPSAIIG